MHWKIGALAKMAGISVRTLHHYEQIGLLTPSLRTEAGYRLYDAANVHRLMQIICLSQIGLPLKEVANILATYPDGILGHLKQHSAHLAQQIDTLKTVQDRLNGIQKKIANDEQPSWIDWAVNPELIELSNKWWSSDSLDTLALYESYLQQEPQWQKQLAELAEKQADHSIEEAQRQADAWDIVALFESITDFNKLCYEQLWYTTTHTSFAQLEQATVHAIRQLWAKQQRHLWQSQLPQEARSVLHQTHSHALATWPQILADLNHLEKYAEDATPYHDKWHQWLDCLSLNNKTLGKHIATVFLNHPEYLKGLCLNEARHALWREGLRHYIKSPLGYPNMNIKIEPVVDSDYPDLVAIWSTSVLATHDFLATEDYEEIKHQLIPNYFPAVTLYKAINTTNQHTLGFIGILDGCVEMLFIDAKARGVGIGTKLLDFAMTHLAATRLDVNEQNEQAVSFYLHYGCTQVSRSALDASGKPYPILSLSLPLR